MTRCAVRIEGARQATRCALCHDDLTPGAAQGCPVCGTATHAECAAEAGGCPTLGCRGVALLARPEPAPRGGRGPAAGAASLLLGFAAGLVATGCPRHVLLLGSALPLGLLLYALLGGLVATRCGRSRLAGLAAAVIGAVAAFAMVLALDGRVHL